jgi:hypothetical protein
LRLHMHPTLSPILTTRQTKQNTAMDC